MVECPIPKSVSAAINTVRESTTNVLSCVGGAGCISGAVELTYPELRHVRPSSPLPFPSHPVPPPASHPINLHSTSSHVTPPPRVLPILGVAGVCPPNPVGSRHRTTPATLLHDSSVALPRNGSLDCRGGIDVCAQPGANPLSATPILPPSLSSMAVTVEAHAKPGSEKVSGTPTVSPSFSTRTPASPHED